MPQSHLKQCFDNMSEQRKTYINKFTQITDRNNGIIAYQLLTYGLTHEYSIISNPIFSYTRYGKPFLRDYPNIHFNISHCNTAVACAISNCPIGVDIETIQPINKETINYTCNQQEIDTIYKSINPNLEFLKIWTKKESYTKMIGTGISNDVKNLLQQSNIDKCFFSMYIQERYVCCCCEMEATNK